MTTATGHVQLIDRKRGPQFYLKYRLPSGRQVQKRLGPAWTERSRPPAGYFTRKTAQAALDALLTDARRGEIPDPGDSSGKTFGDAVAEWLRYCGDERGLGETTMRDYRNTAHNTLCVEFDPDTPLDSIDEGMIVAYRSKMLSGELAQRRIGAKEQRPLSRRTAQKRLVMLGGIFKRAKRLKWVHVDPTTDIEAITLKASGDFNVLTIEQVEATAAKAGADLDPGEAAMYRAAILAAALTGLRTGELRALRWRDVDFAAATVHVRRNMPAGGVEGAPKSGKVRSVPLVDDAARALDGLSRRETFTADDDRVFPNPAGEMLSEDALRDALYAALEAVGIDRKAFPARGGFTFHDLRHTFGTLGAQVFPLHDLQAFMGHADISTTMRYAHSVPKVDAAQRFTDSLARSRADSVSRTVSRTAENGAQPSATTGTESQRPD